VLTWKVKDNTKVKGGKEKKTKRQEKRVDLAALGYRWGLD